MLKSYGCGFSFFFLFSSTIALAAEHPRDFRVYEMDSRLANAMIESQPDLVRSVTNPADPRERTAVLLVHRTAVKSLIQLSCRVNLHCGGFIDITSESRRNSDPNLRRRRFMPPGAGLPPIQKKESVARAIATVRPANIEGFVKAYSTTFKRRDGDSAEGKAAAEWIRNQWSKIAQAAGRSDITVEAIALNSSEYVQPNVRINIPGSDPNAPIVILGGHLDSTSGWGAAPGADDNASGMAALTEAFRVMMENNIHPRSTIQIFGYAAEEAGLVGSRKAAELYKEKGVLVKAALQLDMTAYPGKNHKVTFITDNVDRELSLWTEQLYGTYMDATVERTQCGYACSDHASWSRYGYAATFPCEAAIADSNPNIHSSRDVWDNNLDANYAAQFAKLGYAFAVELAEGF